MTGEIGISGLPARDDVDVQWFMDVIATLPEQTRTELLRTVFRVVVAYERDQDVTHLQRFARSVRETTQLHTSSAFNKAFFTEPKRVEDSSKLRSIEEAFRTER